MTELETKVQDFSKDLREALLDADDLLDCLTTNGEAAWANLQGNRRRRRHRPLSLDVYFCQQPKQTQDSNETDSVACTAGDSGSQPLQHQQQLSYEQFAEMDTQAKKQCIQEYLRRIKGSD